MFKAVNLDKSSHFLSHLINPKPRKLYWVAQKMVQTKAWNHKHN